MDKMISDTERYRQELMRLYSRSTAQEKAEEKETAAELDSRYPEPDISELDEAEAEELFGSEKGSILVNVRTGDDSSAVAGALVNVTASDDGRRILLASGRTDVSGVSPKFSLPVPDILHSQSPSPDERPYSLFDVSVSAEGFFNVRSVNVPVFSGVTSVQNFSLIPVPLMMNGSDETVTYYNTEPDLSGGEE